ncbi:MAG: hypothetical protein IJ880_04850 [Bacilli bacterium]|nr:hypothetical protein [Bacilli bacterium]
MTNLESFANRITIDINPLLEKERLADFVQNYLIPFMDQLQVPYTNVDYE